MSHGRTHANGQQRKRRLQRKVKDLSTETTGGASGRYAPASIAADVYGCSTQYHWSSRRSRTGTDHPLPKRPNLRSTVMKGTAGGGTFNQNAREAAGVIPMRLTHATAGVRLEWETAGLCEHAPEA